MHKIDNWEPDDVIAIICVLGLIILIALGYDGRIVTAFLATTGVYLAEKRIGRVVRRERKRRSTRSR